MDSEPKGAIEDGAIEDGLCSESQSSNTADNKREQY